jgi:hypothetical protein
MSSTQTADELGGLFQALARSRFRSRFHLKENEFAYLAAQGIAEVMQHARKLLDSRLFPAVIPNDGKQTPMRGHPVFLAQHATATCCRECLAKWHRIPAGRALTPPEQDYVLRVIRAWIERDAAPGADERP